MNCLLQLDIESMLLTVVVEGFSSTHREKDNDLCTCLQDIYLQVSSRTITHSSVGNEWLWEPQFNKLENYNSTICLENGGLGNLGDSIQLIWSHTCQEVIKLDMLQTYKVLILSYYKVN